MITSVTIENFRISSIKRLAWSRWGSGDTLTISHPTCELCVGESAEAALAA